VTSAEPQIVSSGGNSLLKELRRLAQDTTAYRKQGRIWLEGDHLCRSALAQGVRPALVVLPQSAWDAGEAHWARGAGRNVVIADMLFAGLSGLESPGRLAFVAELPPAAALDAGAPSVILDRLQDAGNVGTILRCAAAFGFRQVLAIKGTAALWSPKVLRSGMGSHFGLRLIEQLEVQSLHALRLPLITTSSHHGEPLHTVDLPWPCAWAFGHEGQGVGEEISGRASLAVRIIQPGGEESLNVASAAAICLHASAACHAG
jgi:RNA methyltransferase, TrmH family